MLEPSWQTYIDDLAVLFMRNKSETEMTDWRTSGFTERVKYCIQRNALPRDSSWVQEAISRSHCLSEKCEKTSTQYRQDGNRKFQQKLFQQALYDYTLSVRYAPLSCVSLCYGNRSACLYHLQHYKHSILDINRALEAEYPVKLRYKLYYRRSQAYTKLTYTKLALTDLEAAISCLDEAELEDVRKAKLLQDMETDMSRLKGNSGATNPPLDGLNVHSPPTPPGVTSGNHANVKMASKLINMAVTQEQGRHLVANSSINPGDVLIVERPYTSVLLPDHYSTHCHQCLTKTTAPLPCPHCPLVLYCTETCRDDSWRKYHHIECPYLGIMHAIGIAHLAFRIIVTTGLKELLDFRARSSASDNTVDKESYDFGYKSVHDLLHHTDDMDTEDLVQYTLGAIFLLRILMKTDFFNSLPTQQQNSFSNPVTSSVANDVTPSFNNAMTSLSTNDVTSSDANDVTEPNSKQITEKIIDDHKKDSDVDLEMTDDHCYVGGLLLRHIQQLVCNAHAVSDIESSLGNERNERVIDMSDARLGTAIYPTASLLNHSCDPNILSSFLNETLVVRCTRPIKKGEQIYNCYGPHCKRMPRVARQRALLQQYFFICECSECSLPLLGVERHKSYQCPGCAGPLPLTLPGKDDTTCLECNTQYPHRLVAELRTTADHAQEILVLGMKAADQGDLKGAKHHLKQCFRLQKQVLYKEHEDVASTSDQLARIYSLEENYKKAAPYVEYSIKVLGRIHGYDSVEYGLEVKKLAQIQFNALMVDKCRISVDRAIDILKPRLGSQDEMVEELIQMQRCLASVPY